uniref:UDP-N-acetylglucosamine transporter n=1 Tax=Mesocestoides corti TaxID=53468 RepID=A0A5K3F1E5_MESCO
MTNTQHVKVLSLVVLTLQTTALVLSMRYTRLPTQNSGPLYLTSTAVFCAEVCKVVICFCAVFIQNDKSLRLTKVEIEQELLSEPVELLKLAIPSGLYTLQNNLLYVALSNLDAATYQITYQFKIITTAMFMVSMLKKHITVKQWISLLILITGIIFVQLAPSADVKSPLQSMSTVSQNPLVGLCAVILASFSSGFAGVYFEKLMKSTAPSLWIRNIQLGFWGSILALIGVFMTDGTTVINDGFFRGYNFSVVMVIALQSLGGLCVAVVIKYADNILKVFATSISIILSCVASYYLFNDFHPNWYFVVGTLAVLSATALYSLGEYKPSASSEFPSVVVKS